MVGSPLVEMNMQCALNGNWQPKNLSEFFFGGINWVSDRSKTQQQQKPARARPEERPLKFKVQANNFAALYP